MLYLLISFLLHCHMIYNISAIPNDIKSSSILHYKNIKVKSTPWNINKPGYSSDLIWKMIKTCLEDDGVGLAAPQIGIFKQLFIIRHLDPLNKPLDGFITYFNPQWRAIPQDGKEIDTEACLSVPGGVYEVSRWKTIATQYYQLTAEGNFIEIKETLTGYPARVYQHEWNHLQARSIVHDGKKK